MTRVINQELLAERAEQQFFIHGHGRQGETFGSFLRRHNYEIITAPPPESASAQRARTITGVREKLGRFYRPPVKT